MADVHVVQINNEDEIIGGNVELRKGYFDSYSVSPANHHRLNYFDCLYFPFGSGQTFLSEEVDSTAPICSICHSSRSKECLGHRIGLYLPFYMINPQFSKIFIRFLNSICLGIQYNSSGMPPYKIIGCCKYRGELKNRGTISSRLSSATNKCESCGWTRGLYKNYKFEDDMLGGIRYIYDKTTKINVNGMDLMDYISDSERYKHIIEATYGRELKIDIRTLMTNILPIPPSQLRPGFIKPSFETAKIKIILNLCANCKYPTQYTDTSGKKWNTINSCSDETRSIYANIFTHIRDLMTPSNKPDHETIFGDMAGKEGFIRQSVIAAHTLNVGRAVVTPSAENIGQFVISKHFQLLVTQEIVNIYNIEEIKLYAINNYILWIKTKNISTERRYHKNIEINVGDIVYRRLMNGDIISANRQPTLHYYSLFAHNIKFTDTKTVGLHRTETVPYNADFDGDEMNLYPAVSQAAKIELMVNGHVVNNMIGPGCPVVAPVFHELAILMIISIKKNMAIDLPLEYEKAYTASIDFDIRKKSYIRRRQQVIPENTDDGLIVTYRDICSLLFPEDFSYYAKGIRIINGVFISGEFNKSNIGLSPSSITHKMSSYGSKRVAMFVNDVCKICDVYMNNNVVTLNPKHMMLDKDYRDDIYAIMDKTKISVEKALQEKAKAASQIEKDRIERRIIVLLSAPHDYIMNTIDRTRRKNLGILDDNATIEKCENTHEIMVLSGCRGTLRTAAFMMASLGPQYIGSSRFDVSHMPWLRNKHANIDENGNEIQTMLKDGNVDGSLMDGLTPEEYVIHSGPARSQVAKSKLEVATTGYLSKIMATVLSKLRVGDDFAVENGHLVITYCMAGFMDPAKLMQFSVDGHGAALFDDISQMIDTINYEFGY